jgi:hypothetical protein
LHQQHRGTQQQGAAATCALPQRAAVGETSVRGTCTSSTGAHRASSQLPQPPALSHCAAVCEASERGTHTSSTGALSHQPPQLPAFPPIVLLAVRPLSGALTPAAQGHSGALSDSSKVAEQQPVPPAGPCGLPWLQRPSGRLTLHVLHVLCCGSVARWRGQGSQLARTRPRERSCGSGHSQCGVTTSQHARLRHVAGPGGASRAQG